MLRLLIVPFFFCFACGAEGPPDPPELPTETVADVTSLPQAREATEDTVVQDQIDYTREQAPEAPPRQAVAERTLVAPPSPTNTAPAPAPTPETRKVSGNAPGHESWDQLLQRYVTADGQVDYAGIQQNRDALNGYLELLAEDAPDDDWTRNERLAYWINAYNAYTIALILDNWPVESIRDIDEPWKQEFIELEGKRYSLDDIEHGIVRPRFDESRIHFALVCAAASCPPLPNYAFTARDLDEQLGRRARNFIRDENYNVTQEAVVRVSPLFDWYGEDFGDLREYLNGYLRTDIPEGKEITFLDYDWSLNNTN